MGTNESPISFSAGGGGEAKVFFNFSSDLRKRSGYNESYLATDDEESVKASSDSEDGQRGGLLNDSDISDGLGNDD